MRKIVLLLVLAAAFAGAAGVASAATVKTYTVHLKGRAETPKGSPKGTGTFRFQLLSGELCYSLRWSGIGSPTAAHVHKGKAGVAGNVVIVLSGRSPVAHSGCVKVSKALLNAIRKHLDAYYFNVHTARYPGGAIRAQLGGSAPRGSAPGVSAPECGSDRSGPCHIDITVHQASALTGGSCDSFTNREGVCVGPVRGTPSWSNPSYFPRQGIQSSFYWKGPGPDAPRDVDLTEKANSLIVEAYIRGLVPSAGSATFRVDDAYNRVSGVHWRTQALGAAPGLLGGPLYINYDHDYIASSIHIYGYLVPR